MRRYLLLFLLLFPLPASAEYYLLAEPIVHATRVKLGSTAVAAAMLLPTALDNSIYYLATDDAITSSLLFGYCSIYRLPEIAAVSRVANELYEIHKGRVDLKNAACNDGVKKLKVLKTRYGEAMFLTSSQVNTHSFVIAEMEDGKVPAPLNGVDWIPLKDGEDAKIRLQLNLAGSGKSPSNIELPIKDLLSDGSIVEYEKSKEWRSAVKEWNKTRSFIDRSLTQSGLNGLTISSTLVQADGTELPLGEFSRSHGARSFIGMGLYQRLKTLFNFKRRNGERLVTVNEHEVVTHRTCGNLYGRITGRQILQKQP